MTPDFLSTQKAALLAKRASIVPPSRSDIRTERCADPVDDALEQSRREVAAGEVNRVTALLKQIDAALERIAGGVYGICPVCDEPIAEKRLNALPWAERCAYCQNEMERREAAEKAGPKPVSRLRDLS